MPGVTVLAVQHVSCETPGLIADALQDAGITLETIRPDRGDKVPRRIGQYAGLVVMGGPMGVNDQAQYPYLSRELRLLEDALNERRPILGVCLGSQLLATALGAPVTRGRRKEIGWHPVTLGQPAATDMLWHGIEASFPAYHWHGDIFPLPPGAVTLAWSALTECQAFRYGARAYGLLFHLEVTRSIIRRMARTFRNELGEVGLNERQLLDGATQHLPALQAIGRRVFQRWALLVQPGQTANPSGQRRRSPPSSPPPPPERLIKWIPVVDEELCTGCAACVEACGPKSLALVDRLAVLAQPDTCGSEEHCIAPCPTAAIRMVWSEVRGDTSRGKWLVAGRAKTRSRRSSDHGQDDLSPGSLPLHRPTS